MSAKQIIFIIGCGHSGSTLLDMCLGGHPDMSSLGETGFLYPYAHKKSNKDLCTCGAPIHTCPFWTKVSEELAKQMNLPADDVFKNLPLTRLDHVLVDEDGIYRDRLPSDVPAKMTILRKISLALGCKHTMKFFSLFSQEMRDYFSYAKNRYILYDAVAKAHNTPVLIDSSKTPGIVAEAWMAQPKHIDTRFIHMLRDGRAVCASSMRRLGLTMTEAATRWLGEHKKREIAFRSVPQNQMYTLRYEEFCTDPTKELQSLCQWLGHDFDAQMLNFREDRHNVGGNPARFKKEETDIHLDEKWKTSLNEEDLETFYRLTGHKNEELGYKK